VLKARAGELGKRKISYRITETRRGTTGNHRKGGVRPRCVNHKMKEEEELKSGTKSGGFGLKNHHIGSTERRSNQNSPKQCSHRPTGGKGQSEKRPSRHRGKEVLTPQDHSVSHHEPAPIRSEERMGPTGLRGKRKTVLFCVKSKIRDLKAFVRR